MRRCVATAAIAVVSLGLGATLLAQITPADRERARIQNRLGWENMRAEQWDKARDSFQQAIEIDPEFDYAYYGLGRAHMALKQYEPAISALTRCRDLHLSHAGRLYAGTQDAQRARNDRVLMLDDLIRQAQSGPQNAATQDLVRQLQNQRRQVVENIQRGNDAPSIHATVPAYVSLSLGSAYFRAGRLADAEREYKATIVSDSKSGEAHNNLAVVYLLTGRFADAERSIAEAKKVGFRVNPQLEDDIKARRRGGS